MGVDGQRHARAAASPIWTGMENPASAEVRTPECPARSVSLHRLRYPGLFEQ
jgi:hypothetical protein